MRHRHDRCDKCGSPDLLEMPLTPADPSHMWVGDRLMHNIAITRYVCTDCGCVADWVNGADDLKRLKDELLRARYPR